MTRLTFLAYPNVIGVLARNSVHDRLMFGTGRVSVRTRRGPRREAHDVRRNRVGRGGRAACTRAAYRSTRRYCSRLSGQFPHAPPCTSGTAWDLLSRLAGRGSSGPSSSTTDRPAVGIDKGGGACSRVLPVQVPFASAEDPDGRDARIGSRSSPREVTTPGHRIGLGLAKTRSEYYNRPRACWRA